MIPSQISAQWSSGPSFASDQNMSHQRVLDPLERAPALVRRQARPDTALRFQLCENLARLRIGFKPEGQIDGSNRRLSAT